MVLYNIIVTALAVLAFVGFSVIVWQVIRWVWMLVTKADVRNVTWDRIRSWPSNKWDLLPVVGVTYAIAIVLHWIAIALVLPKGQFMGVLSAEEVTSISFISYSPMLVIGMIYLVRSMHETYREIKMFWQSGTRNMKIGLAIGLTFILVGWIVFMIGDFIGWNDLLWFNRF